MQFFKITILTMKINYHTMIYLVYLRIFKIKGHNYIKEIKQIPHSLVIMRIGSIRSVSIIIHIGHMIKK